MSETIDQVVARWQASGFTVVIDGGGKSASVSRDLGGSMFLAACSLDLLAHPDTLALAGREVADIERRRA